GHGLEIFGLDLEERTGAGQAFHRADVDAAPPLRLPGHVVPALGTAADDVTHDVAIDTDAVGHVSRLEDQGLLGKPFAHRRQLAGIHERLDEIGFVIFGQRHVFVNIGDAYEYRGALSLEIGRVGWRR